MQLRQFRVQNFRSVNDSGDIGIDKLTALVGRNESGKTNCCWRLLRSIRPWAEGARPDQGFSAREAA